MSVSIYGPDAIAAQMAIAAELLALGLRECDRKDWPAILAEAIRAIALSHQSMAALAQTRATEIHWAAERDCYAAVLAFLRTRAPAEEATP